MSILKSCTHLENEVRNIMWNTNHSKSLPHIARIYRGVILWVIITRSPIEWKIPFSLIYAARFMDDLMV